MAKISKKRFLEIAEQFHIHIDAINNPSSFAGKLYSEFNKPKNKWIPWDGGECPVDCDTMVAVRFRDGYIFKHKSANYWDWKHRGYVEDIIAYKVIDNS